MRLRRVLHHGRTVLSGDTQDVGGRGRLPVQMDRHHGLHPGSFPEDGVECDRVHRQCHRVDVAESYNFV